MTLRAGITGTENSHADAIIDYLNVDRRHADTRVVALSGGDNRTAELAERGHIETVVNEPCELLGLVDVVFVCDRHGGQHRAIAEPFVADGLPVYIDKPFACSAADASALVDVATRAGALLASYSPLRYAAEVTEFADRVAGAPGPYTIEISGPADPESEYGGIYFYGSHHADIAARLAPGEIANVCVKPDRDGWTATASAGIHRIVLNFEAPTITSGFRLAIPELDIRRGIAIDEHFFWPGLDVFFTAIRTNTPPIAAEDLLRPIQLLDCITREIAGKSLP